MASADGEGVDMGVVYRGVLPAGNEDRHCVFGAEVGPLDLPVFRLTRDSIPFKLACIIMMHRVMHEEEHP